MRKTLIVLGLAVTLLPMVGCTDRQAPAPTTPAPATFSSGAVRGVSNNDNVGVVSATALATPSSSYTVCQMRGGGQAGVTGGNRGCLGYVAPR